MLISHKRTTLRIPTTRLTLRLLTMGRTYVKAAGGIVTEPSGKRLLITRNGRSDLPKGRVEPGETLSQAALREVTEETGLTNIACGRLILKTYHTYTLFGRHWLKQTSWFAMSATEASPIVGQTEEGIEGGEWLPADEWGKRLGTSYGTMKTIVKYLSNSTL